MTTVAVATGQALATLGIGHAFGVVGSGNFAATNALVAGGVPYLAARHEGGAAVMADAYSRVSALPAVLSLHQGCGLTNAMTGITEAAKSRTPMIVLAADTARAATRSNFKIDQDALVSAVGAVSERVHSAQSVYDDVRRAYTTAVSGRRTVVLNLALDIQAQQVTAPLPADYGRMEPRQPTSAGAADIDQLATSCVAASARCSSPDEAPGTRSPSSSRWPRRAARCSPPRRSPRVCSRATRTRSESPEASRRRARQSSSEARICWSRGGAPSTCGRHGMAP